MDSKLALKLLDDMSSGLIEWRGHQIKDIHAALKGAVDRDWNDSRMDVIGQNGNDGDHYEALPAKK